MKLRCNRREATKLAAKVTAKRKAATGKLFNQSVGDTPPGRTVRFRVEFWKLDPDVRVGHGTVEAREGEQVRDLAWRLCEQMLEFMSKKIPEAPSIWDEPVETFRASDEDIPF